MLGKATTSHGIVLPLGNIAVLIFCPLLKGTLQPHADGRIGPPSGPSQMCTWGQMAHALHHSDGTEESYAYSYMSKCVHE